MATYKAYNFAMPTTASPTAISTTTTLLTMLQIAPPSTNQIKPRAWGGSFDGAAAAAGLKLELIETDVAATVTAHSSTGIIKHDPNAPASAVTLSTTATGFTATAEGTITATRLFDIQHVQPFDRMVYEWALGNEFTVGVSKFLRVRVKAAAAVNGFVWVEWDE